jgi:hypothetical protein
VATERGFLVNEEPRRGRPYKLVLGDPLPAEEPVLPDPERLERWGRGGTSPLETGQPINRSELEELTTGGRGQVSGVIPVELMGGTYPVTLVFPPEAKVAVVGDHWRRLASGEIEATYMSHEELALSMAAVGHDWPEVREALGKRAVR